MRLRTGGILCGVVAVALVSVLAATIAGTSARASAPVTGASAGAEGQRPATHRSAEASTPTPAVTPASTPVTTTTVTAPQAQAVAPVAPVPSVASAAPGPSISASVDQAEAAGIDPGPNWTWSIGDTAAHCGAITDPEAATGCTYWVSGVERTVFSGSPSLALVAHEVANAETESDAVPSLLDQVATSEAGTSWSATDAVASCLVDHFLGFQDDAAGTWQCPVALASYVAGHIHDQVVTTETKAVCGTTSGVSSTLTFAANAGSLTVTDSVGGSVPQTATAGASVTVSGIGTFTAVDQGGTVSESGLCQA